MADLKQEVETLQQSFKDLSGLNDKLAEQNATLLKSNEELAAKHQEALDKHDEAMAAIEKLKNMKPVVSSIATKQPKKEPVKLSGKTATVDYKDKFTGVLRKGIKFKLKVPMVRFNGQDLTEAEALASDDCMKFLAQEKINRDGSSLFIQEAFDKK